jgi:cytochrome c biogenesis protein CcmG/thiol:disulfide interchange protein DsbE
LVRIATYLPLAVAAVLAVVFLWALRADRDPSRVPSPFIGKPAPAFELPDLFGGPKLTNAAFEGRVSVLNVFASWCLPCRVEHPFLMALAKDGKAQVLGLNYKDKPEDARNWLDQLGDPYTRTGADLNGRVGIDLGVYGVPETFVIDKQGRIVHKHIGAMDEKVLEKTILPLIAELRGAP